MNSRNLVLAAATVLTFAVPAAAQDQPARVELSLYPVSDLFTTAGDAAAEPSFRSYTPGASLFVRLTSYLGLEGDFSFGLGHERDLGPYGTQEVPAMSVLMGNVVATVPTRSRVHPYVTAGLGHVHMFKREEVGIARGVSLGSANVGGGVKVMFGQWGVRADYRYVLMEALDTEQSPAFVGANGRRAHRIAVGLVFALGR